MAARRGPTKGSRVLVELPFAKKKTSGGKVAGTLVQMKQGVAEALGFTPVKTIPSSKVKFKTASGTATAVRLTKGAYKRKSVKLIFKTPKTIKGSSGKYASVSMPISSGTTISAIVGYFNTGRGKGAGVIALVTPDGVKVQWGVQDIKKTR